jgi:hypothetical protein
MLLEREQSFLRGATMKKFWLWNLLILSALIVSLPTYGEEKVGGGGGGGNVIIGSKKTASQNAAESGMLYPTLPDTVKVNIVPQISSESSPLIVKTIPNEPPIDWLMIIPTWLLAFFTAWLWVATKQMVKETIKSGQNTQRAFVFVKHFEVIAIISPKSIIIIPTWENSGDTPTRNMRNHVNFQYFDNDMPSDFNFPDYDGEEETPVLIGPHASMPASPLAIPPDCYGKLVKGTGHLYIWGWAEYNDVFDDTIRHRTEFCNEVLISETEDHKVATRFRLYKLYNGADGECLKKARN